MPTSRLQPLTALPAETGRSLLGVLTDIDDTLTLEGRLKANAYAAVEALHEAGLLVVAITGRPAGWCDMVARFWPVAGVVGENGAFAFRYDRERQRMERDYAQDGPTRARNRDRLEALRARILAAVPGAAVAGDQPYREADLAIDFREDVPPLPKARVHEIRRLFEEAGATAKISSIHVNGWFGDYDKLGMTRRLLARLSVDMDRAEQRFVYVGDSPNDAPMFAFFTHGVGVANVRDFLADMPALPAYVTEGRGGEGFVELAGRLLALRGAA